MKKSSFTDEQISFVLQQAETGTPVADIIRKMERGCGQNPGDASD